MYVVYVNICLRMPHLASAAFHDSLITRRSDQTRLSPRLFWGANPQSIAYSVKLLCFVSFFSACLLICRFSFKNVYSLTIMSSLQENIKDSCYLDLVFDGPDSVWRLKSLTWVYQEPTSSTRQGFRSILETPSHQPVSTFSMTGLTDLNTHQNFLLGSS